MGRVPTRNKHLPLGMRARHRGKNTYYYLDTGEKPRREIPLGKDYVLAVQQWAQLTASARPVGSIVTFNNAAERYMLEVIPGKAPRTRKDNIAELQNLLGFFGDPPSPLDDIEPHHISLYLKWRVDNSVAAAREKNIERAAKRRPIVPVTGKEGSVRANREKALFSHIWNFARQVGLTNKPNPCAGIKGYRETGRDVYISDEVLEAVYEVAEVPLRDAIDLAYLTGQRPADVRKYGKHDIKDGALAVRQNKTTAKVRVAIVGELAAVIERCKARSPNSLMLINNKHGLPLTKDELRGAFDRARLKAAEAHPELVAEIRQYQFRDLRAKAGTDKDESAGLAAAKDQLGHKTEAMTAHYIRHRRGKLVNPTK